MCPRRTRRKWRSLFARYAGGGSRLRGAGFTLSLSPYRSCFCLARCLSAMPFAKYATAGSSPSGAVGVVLCSYHSRIVHWLDASCCAFCATYAECRLYWVWSAERASSRSCFLALLPAPITGDRASPLQGGPASPSADFTKPALCTGTFAAAVFACGSAPPASCAVLAVSSFCKI